MYDKSTVDQDLVIGEGDVGIEWNIIPISIMAALSLSTFPLPVTPQCGCPTGAAVAALADSLGSTIDEALLELEGCLVLLREIKRVLRCSNNNNERKVLAMEIPVAPLS